MIGRQSLYKERNVYPKFQTSILKYLKRIDVNLAGAIDYAKTVCGESFSQTSKERVNRAC